MQAFGVWRKACGRRSSPVIIADVLVRSTSVGRPSRAFHNIWSQKVLWYRHYYSQKQRTTEGKASAIGTTAKDGIIRVIINECNTNEGAERDERNMTNLINLIKKRNEKKTCPERSPKKSKHAYLHITGRGSSRQSPPVWAASHRTSLRCPWHCPPSIQIVEDVRTQQTTGY